MFGDFERLTKTCRPIRILEEDSASGSRIGGNAPEGVTPPTVNSSTRYFATIALEDANSMELSLFVSMNYDEGSPTSLWENTAKLHSTDCVLVQCVIHPCANRNRLSHLVSELSGHSLEIIGEQSDIAVETRGPLLIPSKLGGSPYFYCDDPQYIASVKRLLEEGFINFLQFTCPDAKQTPHGKWPFFEYTFHLLAKETNKGIIWRYGWG